MISLFEFFTVGLNLGGSYNGRGGIGNNGYLFVADSIFNLKGRLIRKLRLRYNYLFNELFLRFRTMDFVGKIGPRSGLGFETDPRFTCLIIGATRAVAALQHQRYMSLGGLIIIIFTTLRNLRFYV